MTRPLSLEQTAAEIGRSADWLYKNWPKLAANEDFPLPLFSQRPFMWAPEHVEAWKDRRLSDELAKRVAELRGVASIEKPQDDALDAQRQALRKRFNVVG